MNKITLLAISLGTFALAGCSKPATKARLAIDRRQAEARRLSLQEITNEVTGVREIIDLSVDALDANCTNWRAEATVDYINPLGGVDRTNLHLAFMAYEHEEETNIYCHADRDWLARRHAPAQSPKK